MRRFFVGMIRVYQRVLSPLKRTPTCRYFPTCSEYAVEAIETRGVFVGVAKGFWRILRCNPFGGSGFDPVTPRALPDGETEH